MSGCESKKRRLPEDADTLLIQACEVGDFARACYR